MTKTSPTADLARQARMLFESNPDLTLQIYAPGRVGVFGSKATKSKTVGIYHLADGEVGYNLDEARPLGPLMKKALAEQGYADRIANAALLATRDEGGVSVSLIIVAAGDAQAGETLVTSAQLEAEFMKGMPDMRYRIPRPVGALIVIDESGASTVHREAEPSDHWDGTPIPWGDAELDTSVKRQVEQAVEMDMPPIASIRKFGLLQP